MFSLYSDLQFRVYILGLALLLGVLILLETLYT